MTVKWEELEQLNGYGELHRAKVPGGWLVRQLVDYKVKTKMKTLMTSAYPLLFVQTQNTNGMGRQHNC